MTAARLSVVRDGPRRFAIAVRVSRVMGRGGEQFHSPETQEASARRAVEAAGGVVAEDVGRRGVFFDMDVSGGTSPSDRPGLGEALTLVRRGVIGGVACHDLSRWSRETVSGLRELQEVVSAGGQVVTGSETIDLHTPGGIFATTVQLAAQQLKRDEARKAWRETHESRFARGLPHGKLPVGYESDGAGGARPHPVLGPAVADAFRDYAAGRASQPQIAERLGGLRGRPMRQGVVSQLLRNDFFVGVVRYNGEAKPGRQEPLVDDDTWQAVRATLGLTTSLRPASNGGTGLTAILACGRCGKPLHRRGRGADNPGGLVARLRCSSQGRAGEGCAGVGAPRLADVEAALLDLCDALAAGLEEEPEVQADGSGERALVARLEREVQDAVAALGRASVMRIRGALSEEAYDAAAGQLEQELQAARLGLAEAQSRAALRQPLAPADGRRLAQEMRELWPFMLPREKHVDVSQFLARVWLMPAAYRGQDVRDRLRWAEVGDDEEQVWLRTRS